jgi:hypothetical protein
MALSVNELRIGNLVIYEATTHKIRELSTNLCRTTWHKFPVDGYIHGYSEIEPIPLTEDWFLKFGFKKFVHKPIEGEEEKCEEYCIGKISIVDWGNGFILSNSFSFDLRVKLEYVHQLQNLYWCLCGEELTLKSNS